MAREPIQAKDKSALRIFLAIFSGFVGYNAIEAFFTLYAINHLGMDASDGARLLGHMSLFFVLFALVAWVLARYAYKDRLLVRAGIV